MDDRWMDWVNVQMREDCEDEGKEREEDDKESCFIVAAEALREILEEQRLRISRCSVTDAMTILIRQ